MPEEKDIIDFRFLQNGGVKTLKYCGVEFAAPEQDCNIFTICLRDFAGNPVRVCGTDFLSCSVENGVMDFSVCHKVAGLSVRVTADVRGNEIVWGISVNGEQPDCRVEWIDFPRLRLNRFDDGKMLLPFAEGTLIDDLMLREKTASFCCSEAKYPMSGVSSFYPGPASMQLEAYYTPDAGICFFCRDEKHGPKSLDSYCDGDKCWRPFIQHFTGGENTIDYEIVTRGFRGTWEDAAEIYRTWMEQNNSKLPRKIAETMPEWFKKSPVLLVYPVKGSGLDLGGLEPNEYYPFAKALPTIRKYRDEWGGPLMALLMHWEGTAPWAPPYIWPPFGGEALLGEFIEMLHNEGDLLGLYGSGIAWTQKSMIDPSYDCRALFKEKHVESEICLGPHGEAFSSVCNGKEWGQRIGYDLCPDREFTAVTVEHEISKASKLNVDYLQYFDQNQGGAAPLCYSSDHGHPLLPGAWETASMRNLYSRASAAAGKTVLGCENAAAEPYIENCRLNDLRSHLAWGAGGTPVPLYQYLFHEYVSGFSGNGVCLSNWVDVDRTDFFLQWNLAWHFAAGNLLSVVLKNGGEIHWHWALSWDKPAPEQEPLLKLVKNLTRLRRGPAEFLSSGRMEKPLHVSCGTRTVYLRKRPSVDVPAIIATMWSSAGRRIALLVNYGKNPEPCRIDFTQDERGGIVGMDGNIGNFSGTYVLAMVPPLQAIMLELAPLD